MSVEELKYRERAASAHAEADDATLDNVRQRCLRAEAAWLALADRHERVGRARATREAERVDAL